MVGGSIPRHFLRASYFEFTYRRGLYYNHDVVDNRNFLFSSTSSVAVGYDMRCAFSSMRVMR